MAQQSGQSAMFLADRMETVARQLLSSADTLRVNPTAKQDHAGIIESTYSLLSELKDPLDNVMDQMVHLSKFAAMRLFIKWGLFDKIPTNGTISYQELASGIGAKTGLISMPSKFFMDQVNFVWHLLTWSLKLVSGLHW